ncbi:MULTISPECIES: methyltransferase domain-containing protein [unclassified Methylomonas]|uniref:class I SAM-dependent methyltransferase n=1 Tax=unclassified Methylomonas TaxID=2608980 RepID=UPI0009F38416|nr:MULTISPECIES: methyltransferase domain-containing protein [unclassified Methylomonas]WGS85161.1 methyltransferase domain-containing protein [Methylomonas sp. UP202]
MRRLLARAIFAGELPLRWARPETATEWYRTAPDIFADAGRLPIATQSVYVALLLDVLEHLDSVDHAIEEIARILKPGGRLLLQVPFLYPLHDEPRDFTRLSRHGISNLLQRYGLVVEQCLAVGTPMETAGLLTNIAISKVTWDWVSRNSPLMPLILVIPFFVVIIKLAAKVLSWLAYDNDFMPFSYQVSASKPH